jgi:hypothetical protein
MSHKFIDQGWNHELGPAQWKPDPVARTGPQRVLGNVSALPRSLHVFLLAVPKGDEKMSFKLAPGVIRTHNLLIRSQMLYPIELRVRKDPETSPGAGKVKRLEPHSRSY